MSTWEPTNHAKWIIPLAVIPFIVTGIGLIIISPAVEPSLSGTWGMSKSTELLVLGIFFIISPIISLGWIFLWMRRGQQRALFLIKNGISGTAKILNYEETGQTLNDVPKIKFWLEITVSGNKKYELQYSEYVSLLYLSKLKIGKEFSVKIDPSDQRNILIDFDSLKYE
ncbi:hypothetical protein KKF05_00140 [Patescibacteria group bacterium]|nr:hypothetical protein [Patescibacteria group bacterium]MBU1029143.1 hypothetical protein [Patescibacteria group bacterium]